MMKQQPFATKLGLSKMCKAIMILALFKISLLSAIIFDASLTDYTESAFFDASAIAKEKNNPSASILSVSNKIKTTPKDLNAQATTNKDNPKNVISTAALNRGTQQAVNQKSQGIDASNWDTNNGTFPVSTATQGEKNSSPSFFSSNTQAASLEYELLSAGIDSSNAPTQIAANEKSWWQNMLNVKNLPIPGFGTTSVAHAAALDNPPAPRVANSTGLTNFTPSSQRLDEKQNEAQAAANAKSSTTRTSNNYLAAQTGDITQSVTPPAPNVNTYTPTDDPNLKQKELIRREQELLMLKKQMEQRYSELKTAEERVNKLLKSAGNTNKNKTSALVSVYANMKPKQAALALGKIDERVAVQILTGLSPKQAGEILSYADPEVTAKLTELLTRAQN